MAGVGTALQAHFLQPAVQTRMHAMERDAELRRLWDAYKEAAAEFKSASAALAEALTDANESGELRESVIEAEMEARLAVANARELMLLRLIERNANATQAVLRRT